MDVHRVSDPEDTDVDQLVQDLSLSDDSDQVEVIAPPLRRQVKAPRAKNWCFTAFIDRMDEADPKTPDWDPANMKYMVYQKEQCPETRRFHWQGYVQFKQQLRLSAAQGMLGLGRVHMEVARNPKKAIDYCKKLDTRAAGPFEMGEHEQGQGRRSDLERVIDLVKQGVSRKRLAEECPQQFIKYHKGIDAMRLAIQEPPPIDRKVALLVGDTGVGKTRYVMDNFPGAYNVFDLKTPWFDGYDGQEVALLDECGEGMMHYNVLKCITDRYPYRVPVKGGSAAWMASIVFLTSNTIIGEWYPKVAHIHIAALERRIQTFVIPRDLDALDEYVGIRRRGRDPEGGAAAAGALRVDMDDALIV